MGDAKRRGTFEERRAKPTDRTQRITRDERMAFRRRGALVRMPRKARPIVDVLSKLMPKRRRFGRLTTEQPVERAMKALAAHRQKMVERVRKIRYRWSQGWRPKPTEDGQKGHSLK